MKSRFSVVLYSGDKKRVVFQILFLFRLPFLVMLKFCFKRKGKFSHLIPCNVDFQVERQSMCQTSSLYNWILQVVYQSYAPALLCIPMITFMPLVSISGVKNTCKQVTSDQYLSVFILDILFEIQYISFRLCLTFSENTHGELIDSVPRQNMGVNQPKILTHGAPSVREVQVIYQ